MKGVLWPALRATLVLWVLCGLLYPLTVTALGQWLFPFQANGSLVRAADGRILGSRLIGQNWTETQWFHGRPSATTSVDPTDPTKSIAAPYNAANSGGSNLGPTSRALDERLRADRWTLDRSMPTLVGKRIPSDMLTTSGSGLDPDISPAFAALQVSRVSAARGIPAKRLFELLRRHVENRALGIFGEPRVNVLELNLDLQRSFATRYSKPVGR